MAVTLCSESDRRNAFNCSNSRSKPNGSVTCASCDDVDKIRYVRSVCNKDGRIMEEGLTTWMGKEAPRNKYFALP